MFNDTPARKPIGYWVSEQDRVLVVVVVLVVYASSSTNSGGGSSSSGSSSSSSFNSNSSTCSSINISGDSSSIFMFRMYEITKILNSQFVVLHC